jgi:hypothetical protein
VWLGMRATVRCIHVSKPELRGENWDIDVQTMMQTSAHCISEGQSPFARAEKFDRDWGKGVTRPFGTR